jgi:hypothetical protein
MEWWTLGGICVEEYLFCAEREFEDEDVDGDGLVEEVTFWAR